MNAQLCGIAISGETIVKMLQVHPHSAALATSGLDQQTAERFGQTVNKLRSVATVVFISHQLPKGLSVDDAHPLNAEKAIQMRVVGERKR